MKIALTPAQIYRLLIGDNITVNGADIEPDVTCQRFAKLRSTLVLTIAQLYKAVFEIFEESHPAPTVQQAYARTSAQLADQVPLSTQHEKTPIDLSAAGIAGDLGAASQPDDPPSAIVNFSTYEPSRRLLEAIKQVEGVRKEVYKDSAGYPTIGVGHLLTKSELSSGKIVIDGRPVKYREGLTDEEVTLLLEADLDDAIESVRRSTKDCDLTVGQVEALISFVFNVGGGAFGKSTMLKRIKAGQFSTVPDQFRRWVFAGGAKSKGLANRREHEIQLWQGQIA